MIVNHKYVLTTAILGSAILLGACGPAASNAPVIATSVAQTVEAQGTQAAAIAATPPPVTTDFTLMTSPTPLTTKAPPTAPTGNSTNFCTASATFVSETIPDGTIMSPGQIFTKIWRIKNSGTCPWYSTTWKLVYVSGDLMGAATVFNFPQPASPGQTVDVPIVFTAPQASGSYRGYWKIQSPWGLAFGDSGSGNAFWVDIVVGNATPGNAKTQTLYGITSVTYDEPVRQCTTANTFWNVTAHISSNGPVDIQFTWLQSDGHAYRRNYLSFPSASTLDVTSPTWSQGIASSTNPRWVQIIVTAPTYQEFAKSPPLILCGQ